MIRCKIGILRNSGESLNSTVALITSFAKKFRVCYLHLGTSAFLGKDYFIVLRFLRNNVLELCSKFIRCNSSNFVIGASRGETHCKSALKNIFIYCGLLVSLHRAIPFLWLVRPPGLLARCVSCRVQKRRWFLWTSLPVRSCNVSLALYHVGRQKFTMVICCLDMLYCWFRDLHPNHIWRRQAVGR